MVGKNTIYFCKADMIAAMQYWLNQVVMKEPVEVTHVSENPTGVNTDTFRVDVIPLNPEKKIGE